MSKGTYYFTGKAMWAECNKINKYGKYAIKLKVDKETAKQYKAIGTKGSPKELDDGDYLISFTRKPTDKVFKNGEKVEAGPPEVIDAMGVPYKGDIGNDSDVTVKVSVFSWDNSFGKGTAARLEKVRVDKLVEWKPSDQKVDGGNVNDDFIPF